MSVLSARMCTTHVNGAPLVQNREGTGSPGIELQGMMLAATWMLGIKLDSSGSQPVLVTAELSLAPEFHI